MLTMRCLTVDVQACSKVLATGVLSVDSLPLSTAVDSLTDCLMERAGTVSSECVDSGTCGIEARLSGTLDGRRVSKGRVSAGEGYSGKVGSALGCCSKQKAIVWEEERKEWGSSHEGR